MSLGAFALVASEFMPVSLLTPIAADLGISEGQAGQAIAISGAFALVTSLCISSVAGRLDRRRLLLGLMLLMILSGTVVAFAPNNLAFMAGRALIGVAIGGFWSMSAATVMRLVPPLQVPRALAVLNGGNALATVLAAPLGSFLGGIVGWRWAFFAVVPVAGVALLWALATLPRLPARVPSRPGGVIALLRRPMVVLGMLASGMFFMGQFALFVYLRPFLETVTHLDVTGISLVLLLLGASGLAGTFLIGRYLSGPGLYRTLCVIPMGMAVIAVALMVLGGSAGGTALLAGLWGLLATAAPVGWWTWLARTLPDDAEAGGGLLVAIVQLSITLGATVGGLLYDMNGYRGTFTASALMLVTAAVLAHWVGRRARQGHDAPAAALAGEHGAMGS
ncbi:MFS transporter [Bordetella genomosp. 5]|uniref:MFS transporter n=1 Tax=Bordetella genomosp. 5 TaxID=1395608 RepID=A0A261TI18_9BORD|nr:MFS transporter [Bordetella genomosp. 5]OZI49055.1 MFS transporter [Bordetella genomosp. 5]